MFLTVDEVSKSFEISRNGTRQRVHAIDRVSFSMEEGAFVSIIGPSGCGKSTLLRLIDGLQEPDSGSVRIRDRVVRGPGPDRGMVFQHHNLMPWRTVVRNVEFGLEMLGVGRAERRERALRHLDQVGLRDFADAYPGQLSGGMQQRVGLVRAMVVEPEILLMDEPFGALDAQTKVQLQEQLEELWFEERRSVVFITHDIEEALYLSDRVLVMANRPGRIIEEITVPFDRPRPPGLRADAEFGKLRQQAWELLQDRGNDSRES